MIKTREDVSKITISRMVVYYNTLKKMKEEGEVLCASNQLGQRTGISASVIRRDLACFGGFGTKGVGYEIGFLLAWIGEILGYNTEWKVLLVGIGSPLTGIGNYNALLPPGFKITAVVDINKNNKGYKIPGLNLTVQPMENLASLIKEQGISIGLLNVMPRQAQKVVDMMVKAGIKGVANLSAVPVCVPGNISLSQMNVNSCLSQLSYNLSTGVSEEYLCQGKNVI